MGEPLKTFFSAALVNRLATNIARAYPGAGAPKVFKLGRIALRPRERVEPKTTFSLAVHTTRVPRPGRHTVDVIVNGHSIRVGLFNVSNP